MDLTETEKLEIMETEYRIPLDDRMREDVNVMCNLSQGVQERGEAIGEARGIEIGQARGIEIGEERMILQLYKKGYSAEQIAGMTDRAIEKIESIIESGVSALA